MGQGFVLAPERCRREQDGKANECGVEITPLSGLLLAALKEQNFPVAAVTTTQGCCTDTKGNGSIRGRSTRNGVSQCPVKETNWSKPTITDVCAWARLSKPLPIYTGQNGAVWCTKEQAR